MLPEQKARIEIDRRLEAAGWVLQDFEAINPSASLGVAVREFPLLTGQADYLLYISGQVAGVVEAKPEGYPLIGVEVQSLKYMNGLPENVPCHGTPLAFAYESTGTETRFTNSREPNFRSREVFTFHRPEELLRQLGLEAQLRERLTCMPPVIAAGLWPPQVEAVQSLDRSLAENRPRALIQMATGSGKTFAACTFCYRLLKFAGAKRILFLVDRNNLGRQAMTEFQDYRSPYTNRTYTEEYVVQHQKGNSIDPASKVVVTTIQRLYSILRGEEEFPEELEESSLFEPSVEELLRPREPMPVVYSPAVPIETFDFIVVDECHRSIYNVWRQVLEYFDAFLIGLTATPTKQTLGFFYQNLVQDYSHARAVADGVNVDFEVYRIRTKVTAQGATLEGEPGFYVAKRDRRTRRKRYDELDEDLTYTGAQLDRDVVALDQIRTVVRTFKERLPEIFPGRSEVPKTLVFAKYDNHAEDIVEIIRQEFGVGNEFCQKITSKTTGKKPEEVLSDFRNSYNPRIAVTVDMIATGTDVRPLECLLFMRNVESVTYFEQMKGRGVRIVNPDDLQAVTPDATCKSHFVIVDAVGVTEQDRTDSRPLDRKPSVPLKQILQVVGMGVIDPDLASTLAARLLRLEQEVSPAAAGEVARACGGKTLGSLASDLIESIDPDRTEKCARTTYDVDPDEEPSEEQLDAVEREAVAEALKPFHEPELRQAILGARASLDQIIDHVTADELLDAGFSMQAKAKARDLVDNFRSFVAEHRDELEAIQILYSRPYRAGLRYGQVKELAAALRHPPLFLQDHPQAVLWTAYEVLEPEKVQGGGGKALVDLVALVRHAITPDEPLLSVRVEVEERYEGWLLEQKMVGVRFTDEQLRWLVAIKDHIANALAIQEEDFEEVPFSQMGGLGQAYQLFGERLSPLLAELNEALSA